ncbi:hypothetical protein SISNIDRAFT_464014 [Sistotremastrum niveocremeum HHB9708]|uniref:Uncharacterized protein n=1 Tax=Sistotremastrum niveocremeum HHB9708 TaxID=1314777 RepID=A0A164Y3L4_9AGAM|nr:hypothetical protein SISNIDRAFT_464014 [Sistotremastrum niveocremeum HHB9708]
MDTGSLFSAQSMYYVEGPPVPTPTICARASDRVWIVSSNAEIARAIPPLEGEVRMRSDGHFGHADHTLTAQWFCAPFPHLPFIPTSIHPTFMEHSVIWSELDPSQTESDQREGHAHVLRRLQSSPRERMSSSIHYLSWMIDELLIHVQLDQFMNWQDLLRCWGEIQRYWLEVAGMGEYMRLSLDPRDNHATRNADTSHWIGSFSNDPHVIGFLSWYHIPIWSTIESEHPPIGLKVLEISPDLIEAPIVPFRFSNDRQSFDPFPYLGSYSAVDSRYLECRYEFDKLFLVDAHAHVVQLEPTTSRTELGTRVKPRPLLKRHTPLTNDGPESSTRSSRPYHVHSSAPSSSTLDLSDFDEQSSPAPSSTTFEPPLAIPEWGEARAYELQQRQATRPKTETRAPDQYIFPPSQAFATVAAEKRLRFVVNWLSVRSQWLVYVRTHNSAEISFTAQQWKDFLSHTPQRGPLLKPERAHQGSKATRKTFTHQILQVMHSMLPEGVPTYNSIADLASLTWFQYRLDSQHEEENIRTHRLVLWELDELAFRYSFLRLEEHFANTVALTLEEKQKRKRRVLDIWSSFPTENDLYLSAVPHLDCGIGSTIWHYSVPALNAASEVMQNWPHPPDVLKYPLLENVELNSIRDVRAKQQEISAFFCARYAETFGQVPVVPSRLPLFYG